ncbi:hypothetical protein D3C85_1645890 [compost metagenome]
MIDFAHNTNYELLCDNSLEDDSIIHLIEEKIRKEKFNQSISNIMAIIGFFMLLVILTLEKINIMNISLYNNILTSLAFLSVLANITLKENYRTKSFNEINRYKDELNNL